MTIRKAKNAVSSGSSGNLRDDREKLVQDLKILMEDAKGWPETASDESKDFAQEKAEQVRQQLEDTMNRLKNAGNESIDYSKEKTRRAGASHHQ